MIDPLLDAVETLSTLVDQLRELRRTGETAKGQIEAMDRLIDETIETLMSLLARIPEDASCERQSSASTSATVHKSYS